jgi:ketosteroid isomerase-like protein
MGGNLDLVRSIYADWERGDFTRTGWAHPAIEVVWPDGPAPATWSGLANAEAGWREFLGNWEDYRVAAERYLTPDEEHVLALVTYTARGKVSGLQVGESGANGANLFHVHGGRVRRLVLYWSRERALADLGLVDQAVSQENVEIVRRVIDAFNRRDIDMALRDAVPDATLDWSRSRGLDAGIYVGTDAIRRFWTEIFDAFEQLTLVPEDFIADGGHVMVPNTALLTGRGGIEVKVRSVSVARLQDGRLVEWTIYQDLAEAVKAEELEA